MGIYRGATWTRLDDLDRAVVRGGLAGTVRAIQVRLGGSFTPGVDDRPTIELGFRRAFEVD